MVVTIFIIIAAVLGFLFPSYLIGAIRSTDKKAAAEFETKACAVFSAIVLIVLLVIES